MKVKIWTNSPTREIAREIKGAYCDKEEKQECSQSPTCLAQKLCQHRCSMYEIIIKKVK